MKPHGPGLALATFLVGVLLSGCPTRVVYYPDAGAGGQGGTATGGLGGTGPAQGGVAGHSPGGSSGGMGGQAQGGSGGSSSSGSGGAGGRAEGGSGGHSTGGSGGASGAAGQPQGGSVGRSSGSGGSVGGAGGTTTNACQPNTKRCAADGLEACGSDGQWGAGVPCGGHQSCVAAGSSAQCKCNTDPTCGTIGKTCTAAGLLASCSQDGDGCFYASSAESCANGACSGAAGSASCCTNACSSGAAQCLTVTSAETCNVGSNGCSAWSVTNCGSGLVCERSNMSGCVDPSWAEWPMSNGQQDVLNGAPNLNLFTDNGDGTVTDDVTGLMWQQVVTSMSATAADASVYCASLRLAGYTTWRTPSLIELISIVNYDAISPAINGTAFPSAPSDAFISSTPFGTGSAQYLGVDFGTGRTSAGTNGSVRCVR